MTARLMTAATMFATLALGMVPVAAVAQDYRYDRQYEHGYYDNRGEYRDRDGYGGGDARRGYYSRQAPAYVPQGYYGQQYADGYDGRFDRRYDRRQPQRYYGRRGYDQQYRYRCRNNNTGTILGAIAGGLIGNGVAGRGDRLLGTVLGGGVGAVAGNSIDRNNRRC